VAIIGIPNVGKSTLANQLFGQQRSITADMPGTTRDWVGELADVDGVPIVLLDTPGVRDSSDAIEQSAIALSRGVIASADLVIVVIDPTQPLAPQRALAEHYAKPIVVLNKSDLGAVDFAIDVKTIATTGEGLSEVRSLIRARLGCDDLAPSQPRWWTSRQRDELTRRLELPLEYASLPAKSGVASILLSVFVTTFCFAAAHLVAESVTGYLATFRFHWLGPASNPRQLAKLQDQYFFDMFTEVLWLVPATALVLLVQLGLGMYGRGNLRRGMWAMGLVVGLCYCWARWGLWGLSKAVGFPFPESANFLSSMLMAVASGLVLAAWRNRGHQ
jgi:small GTP-binding protein